MNFFETAITLFFILDPLGNIPAFLAILKDFDPRRQRIIILKEMIIALAVLLFFVFLGDQFFQALQINPPTVQISGGIILFVISLQMIFPPASTGEVAAAKKEPFIVPLAVPFIAGPAIITTVIVYAQQHKSVLSTTFALGAAWAVSTLILVFASSLRKFLGQAFLSAAERLMGMILVIFAVNMCVNGIQELF